MIWLEGTFLAKFSKMMPSAKMTLRNILLEHETQNTPMNRP